MKKLLFGTTNPAKIEQIRGALVPLGIDVEGVTVTIAVPKDGETAPENARTKALCYAEASGGTVFAMDNALYLDGLSPDEQPGLQVRRIPNHDDRVTDQEMLDYYAQLIGRLGDPVTGEWHFAVCIATPDGRISETIIRSPRRFVNKPSPMAIPGYPLESLQIEPSSGKYIAEMTQAEKDRFWQQAIGAPLATFIQSAIDELSL